jgi:hypothetical protein
MTPRLRKKIQTIGNRFLIDTGDYQNTVFLAGTGRSGTTWVEEVINHDNSFRVIFEPFSIRKLGLLKGWKDKQYLREENMEPLFVDAAREILNGNVKAEAIDHFNFRYIARRRIVKDIRANLLLRWMKRHFPEMPIILLLRHPCAVASSKLELGWDTDLDSFLCQEDLVEDFLAPLAARIGDTEDPFDKHIFMWCIENYVPLCQFDRGEILVLFYEHLCLEPRREIERIMSFIGERFSIDAVEKSRRPSLFSRKHSAVLSGGDPVSAWMKKISENQTERAISILRTFGLDRVYGPGPVPLLTGEDILDVFPDTGPHADRAAAT